MPLVSRLQSHLSSLTTLVSCLTSPVSSLLFHVSCLTSPHAENAADLNDNDLANLAVLRSKLAGFGNLQRGCVMRLSTYIFFLIQTHTDP